MPNSELHQIALKWINEVTAAASGFAYQLSYLPDEWSEQLAQTELLIQEHEKALDEEFPTVSAFRKTHFRNIWNIVHGPTEFPDALQYMEQRVDEGYELIDQLELVK